jgi:hypothetical protein
MRHIKLYEGILRAKRLEGFEEIDYDIEKLYSKFVKLPEAIVKKLQNFGEIGVFLHGKEVSIDSTKGEISVYCDDDEWYYVSTNAVFAKPTYYKCDQWDGLVNCLNSL